jgi:hypothetical protein
MTDHLIVAGGLWTREGVESLLAERNRLREQRDKLFARLEADPERAGVAAVDGLRKLWAEDGEQCDRILDWIGVPDELGLSERVRILALDVAVRRGMSMEDAERAAPPAFKREEEIPLTRYLGSACDAVVGVLHLLDSGELTQRQAIKEIRETMDRLYQDCPEALSA